MNHDSRSFEDDLTSLKADVAVIRSNYVTKADLQELRIELKSEIQDVRTEIQAVRTELKLDIEKLRVELHIMGENFHRALHAQTWKMYGFGVVLVTAVHFVTRAGY
jgi:hypothetical protein